MAVEKTKVVNIETGKAQSNVKSLKQQIKELREAMATMTQGSDEWNAAAAKLGDALHKQEEIAIAGKKAMNDFGNVMSNFAGVGAGVVAGVNGITSALSLMGVEIEKDDVGMIKFTQSMMAIVQALATVDTATKAWNGLMVSLNAMLDQKIADTVATEANTAATEQNTAAATKNAAAKAGQAAASGENAAAMGAETVAAGAGAKATTGLAGAFGKLAKALKMSKAALGIVGIALAAVGAIATAVIKHFQKLREEQEEAQAQATKWKTDAANAAAEVTAKYQILRQSFIDAKSSGEKLTKWMKEHKKELNDIGLANSTIAQLEDAFINRTQDFINALTKRYEAQWKLQAIQEEYVQNLKDINALQTLYNTFGVPNSRGDKFTLMIDGEKVKKSYGEWLDASNRAKFSNDKLLKSVNGLVKELTDADLALSKFGADFNNITTTTKQWSNEIQQLKDDINGLSDNITTTSMKLKNSLKSFNGAMDTFNNAFRQTSEEVLESHSSILDSYNILSQETWHWFDRISKEGENIEQTLSDAFTSFFDPQWVSDIETFTNTLAASGDIIANLKFTGGRKIIDLIEGITNKLRENNGLVNTKNLFDEEGLNNFLSELTSLEKQIDKVQGEYNTLSNRTGTMTEADEKALKQKQKTLEALKREYSQLSVVAEAYQKIIDSYQENHDAQLQLFEDYTKLIKRLRDFDKELAKGSEWKYEDRVQAIRDEIAAEEDLIKTLREQINMFPPNAARRIELENQVLDHLVTVRQKEREITRLTYEENLKNMEKMFDATEKRLTDYDTLVQRTNNLMYLGADTYNDELDRIQIQIQLQQEKFDTLESFRQQDLISEEEYLNQKQELTARMAELEVAKEQETSNRKLRIAQAYFNAYRSINNAISGILGELIEAEEGNIAKQKELRIAQTWMTGIMGSIEALVSGIQSGIPAPGNFILGGVLSAATIAETALAVSNIKRESAGGQTSGATNINVPTYETLAYENDSAILDNISDSRVYVVESDIQAVGQHVDTIENEAIF